MSTSVCIMGLLGSVMANPHVRLSTEGLADVGEAGGGGPALHVACSGN